jgi:nucleotide-binding universal stress UspA family protein
MAPVIPEIAKILYATDASRHSLYAFNYAVQFARGFDAKIVVLHVIEPAYGTFGPQVKKLAEEKGHEEAIREMRANWQHYCEAFDKQTSCLRHIDGVLICAGNPVEEILKTAEEQNCDMLVLGSHGKGFLKHGLLGSVSRKVLDRASKPVVIIPLPADAMEWDEDRGP